MSAHGISQQAHELFKCHKCGSYTEQDFYYFSDDYVLICKRCGHISKPKFKDSKDTVKELLTDQNNTSQKEKIT